MIVALYIALISGLVSLLILFLEVGPAIRKQRKRLEALETKVHDLEFPIS